jgi:hypothetical protein
VSRPVLAIWYLISRRYRLVSMMILKVLVLIILLQGCTTKAHVERAEYMDTPQYQAANSYLEAMKARTDIYYGEGLNEIGGDIAQARDRARNQALEILSSQIEVAVRADIEVILTGENVKTGRKFTEEVRETVTSRTETYTNQVLTNIRGNRQLIDYPLPGYITYFVYIDKLEYEEKVRRDLEAKRNFIRDMIRTADQDYRGGAITHALQGYGNAFSRLYDFFSNLPVEMDINDTGITEEVSTLLTARIGRILRAIELRGSEDRYLYDASGKLSTNPLLSLAYRRETGEVLPVNGFPLSVIFIEGSGRLPPSLITGKYGQLELSLREVDPTNNRTTLVVELDTAAFPSLEKMELPHLPRVLLNLEKLKTIVLSFTFSNDGSLSVPRDLQNSLLSVALGRSLSVIERTIMEVTPSQRDIQNARLTNADYLVHIYVETGEASTLGGYQNMFAANGNGMVYAYALPGGDIVFAKNISTTRGFGSTPAGAGWDALGLLREEMLSHYREALEAIGQ